MRCLLPLVFCFAYSLVVADEWTPPENPDPQAILWEAKKDTRAGRYEVALQKQLWYHNNALRLQPAQSGVRLSFALSNWLELGEEYPPALAKMKEVREDVEKRIRDEDQVRVKFADFHEFVAFNRTLREEQRTVDLFLWLHESDQEDAGRVYHVARPALIKAEQYKVCGEFVDADKDAKRIVDNFKRGVELAENRFGKDHLEYVHNSFLNSATTLAALLVVNDQKAEAEQVAEKVKAVVEDPDLLATLNKQMESALKGTVPKPWP